MANPNETSAEQETDTLSATPSTTEATTQAHLVQDDDSPDLEPARDNVIQLREAYGQASRWIEDNYRSPLFIAGALATCGIIAYLVYRAMRESETIELS